MLCSSPVDGAVTPEPEYLNMGSMTAVIRDFQPNHSDFENFSEEATTQLEYESIAHLDLIYNYVTRTGVAMKDNGYGDDWYTAVPYHASCGTVSANAKYGSGTQIGVDGLPMDENTNLPEYLRQTSAGPVLEFGECQERLLGINRILRGYANALESIDYYDCPNGKTVWSNPVIATTGMVQPYLKFAAGADGKIDMIDGVTISKLNERCDNANFDQWFTDVPSVNKRVNTTLNLIKDPESDDYIYSRGYNNGGFFPLDSINPDTHEWVMNKPCDPSIQPNGMCEQYEPQSLSIYCPPYDYQYARTQSDEFQQNTYELCAEWLNQGGPRAINSNGSGHSAAWQAMLAVTANKNTRLGLQHIRNFHFTMMAYSTFKYDAAKQATSPQNLEFISSGDMWVFVDGVLVADMGGDHMPVPSKVSLRTLAENNHGCHAGEPLAAYENCKGSTENSGWADGSVHHLHIFYANLQTNGSEIYIRTIPVERTTYRVEPLSMNKLEVVKDSRGNTQNRIYMNLPFADSTVAAMTSRNLPSMIVLRDDAEGKTKVLGLYLLSLMDSTVNENGEPMYQFEGVLKDVNGNTVEGGLRSLDRVAFNVPWSEALENGNDADMYLGNVWKQMMAWSKMMLTYIASSSGKQIVTFTANNALNKLINSCAE